MARKTVVELIDDFDGSKADETVTFALDGVAYEVDLTAKNARELRQALDAYIHVGRRARGGSTSAARRASSHREYDPAAVRAWAMSNGVQVSGRGRISAAVVQQFRSAGN